VKEEPAAQVMAAEGEGRGGVERRKVMVEYERFREKKVEKGGREERRINMEDCHPESQGDGGQPFSASLLRKC